MNRAMGNNGGNAPDSANTSREIAAAKACCADLYQSDLARLVLGDTLHPGGLRLTNRLGRLMAIRQGGWVVDLASGSGASALAISRTFHCRVVGIEFGRQASVEALARSRQAIVPGNASFLQGDAELPPLKVGAFDGVFSECSLSLFPDKALAVKQAVSLIKSGGRLGLSDVTLTPGSLPAQLEGPLGQVLCLTDALDSNGYARLLRDAGLSNVYLEDASFEISALLARIKAGLAGLISLHLASSGDFLPTATDSSTDLGQWRELIDRLEGMVKDGKLGYWLFVGEKP